MTFRLRIYRSHDRLKIQICELLLHQTIIVPALKDDNPWRWLVSHHNTKSNLTKYARTCRLPRSYNSNFICHMDHVPVLEYLDVNYTRQQRRFSQ